MRRPPGVARVERPLLGHVFVSREKAGLGLTGYVPFETLARHSPITAWYRREYRAFTNEGRPDIVTPLAMSITDATLRSFRNVGAKSLAAFREVYGGPPERVAMRPEEV